MNDSTLPRTHYAIKYFSGEPRAPWFGVRVEGHTCERITWGFKEPIDAAEETMSAARSEGLPLVMPEYLKASVIAQWQQRGAWMYAKGIAREWCGNSYIANGWDVAHQADAEPFRSRAMLDAA